MASDRVVRRLLADGTTRVYRYPRHTPRPGRNAPGTFGALIEAYQRSPEWSAKRATTVEQWNVYLPELDGLHATPVTAFRRKDALRMRDELAAERGHSAANRVTIILSTLLKWAVDREWIEYNVMAKVKRIPGGPGLRAWTVEEYDLIMPQLPEPLRRAVVLARHTGQRRGDLIAMRWSQYDGATLRLTQHKTGARLVLPVPAELRAELDAWRSGAVVPHPDTLILTTHWGRPWDGKYISRMIWQTVADLDPAFGGLNLHGLRKLAAAEHAELGATTREIMAITGHTTLAEVERYTRSADQERMAGVAVTRLDAARRARDKRA